MKTIHGFPCVYYEKDLENLSKDDGAVRFQIDNPSKKGRAKLFSYGTKEKIYDVIKSQYDKGQPCSFYEYRDPSIPCNFHVDIDSSEPTKEEYDEEKFLIQVRKDFNDAGITKPWKLQSTEEKAKYRIKGDFVWDVGVYSQYDILDSVINIEEGQRAKAVSSVWECPFDNHENNRMLKITSQHVYCYGCKKEYSLEKRQKVGDRLLVVPRILPEDLFVGTDECYGKTMLAWFGHDFVFSTKSDSLFLWKGDIWQNAEHEVFYVVEKLYDRMLQELKEKYNRLRLISFRHTSKRL
eukprot:g7362.t1